MKFTALFLKMNTDFSPEHAEMHHNGEASENNRMFEWEDELNITTEVKKVEVEENAIYILRGERNGNTFEEPIAGMRLFNVIGEDGSVTQLACSEELVEDYKLSEDEKINLEVRLKGEEPLSNPVPGIYIALQKFPKTLID